MTCEALDTVVLVRDLPEHALHAGDRGAVVEVVVPDGLEVEFVTASGRTTALMTLAASDARPIADADVVAVRSLGESARPETRLRNTRLCQRRFRRGASVGLRFFVCRVHRLSFEHLECRHHVGLAVVPRPVALAQSVDRHRAAERPIERRRRHRATWHALLLRAPGHVRRD
ncbi:MAG: DUF4926 domain-containing protein, partial [Planctomycetota bacterium]